MSFSYTVATSKKRPAITKARKNRAGTQRSNLSLGHNQLSGTGICHSVGAEDVCIRKFTSRTIRKTDNVVARLMSR